MGYIQFAFDADIFEKVVYVAVVARTMQSFAVLKKDYLLTVEGCPAS